MDPVAVREERSAARSGASTAPAAAPDPAGGPQATVTRPSVYSSRTGVRSGGYRLIQLAWAAAIVVDAILALDFVFRATGAHNVGFAHYVYRLGSPLASPFNGIFSTTTSPNGVSAMRWSDVLAFAVYTVAAWVVTKLIRVAATPRTGVSTV